VEPLPSARRLAALSFDPAPLAAEALAVPDGEWVPHFHVSVYRGVWSGAALRSVDGRPGLLYPELPPGARFEDTALLDACPATRAVLARLECPVLAARFLYVAPGTEILPHGDPGLGWAHGEVRLHLPVLVDDACAFLLDGEPVAMAAGECWYLDVSRPHAVVHAGDRPRVHLVVDCRVDPWLAEVAGLPLPS
jgi:hypothetical protein